MSVHSGERTLEEDAHPQYVRTVERWQQKPAAEMSIRRTLEGARQLLEAAAIPTRTLQTGVIPAVVRLGSDVYPVYNRLIKRLATRPQRPFCWASTSRRSWPKNRSTTWPCGRGPAELADYLCARRGSQIAADLEADTAPAGVPLETGRRCSRFAAYLEQYGHPTLRSGFRQTGPRPMTRPPLLETLQTVSDWREPQPV